VKIEIKNIDIQDKFQNVRKEFPEKRVYSAIA